LTVSTQSPWHRSWNVNEICELDLHGAHAGEIDLTLILFSDEAWCHHSRHVNAQKNRHWSAENLMSTHESATMWDGLSVVCTDCLNWLFIHWYVTHILTFLNACSYTWDNVTAHTANSSVCCWWQNNKQENVASLFTRSEYMWILHKGHVTGWCV
jgi:hypothetical protein